MRAATTPAMVALRLTEQLDSPALAGFIDAQLRARLADADWAQPLGRLLAHALEHDGRAAVWETLVRLLDQALASIQERTVVSREIEDLVSVICREARPGDQILVMSNGGFAGIHDRLLRGLSQGQ